MREIDSSVEGIKKLVKKPFFNPKINRESIELIQNYNLEEYWNSLFSEEKKVLAEQKVFLRNVINSKSN